MRTFSRPTQVAKLRELLAKSDAADGDLSGLIIGVHVGVGTCSQRSVAAPSEVADALALLWSVATDEKRGPSVRLNSIGVLASAISMDDGCYTRAVDTDLLKSAIDFLGTLSTADRASESNVALTINTTVLIQSLTQNANKQCESAIGKGVLPILRELLSHPQPHVVEAAADMCCQLGEIQETTRCLACRSDSAQRRRPFHYIGRCSLLMGSDHPYFSFLTNLTHNA